MFPFLFYLLIELILLARCNNALAKFELHKKAFSQSKLKISIKSIITKYLLDFILSCKPFLGSMTKHIEISFFFDKLGICTGQINIYC